MLLDIGHLHVKTFDLVDHDQVSKFDEIHEH